MNGELSEEAVEEKSARAPSLTESELSSPSILSPKRGEAFPIPVKPSPTRNRKVKSISGTSSSPSAHRMTDAFPTISYSSSEDEDEAEFFDANEYEHDNTRFVYAYTYISI